MPLAVAESTATASDGGRRRQTGAATGETMSPLNSRLKAELRSRAQRFKPVFAVGAAGVTDSVLAELRGAFAKCELIKVRIRSDDRDEVRDIADQLAERTPCHLIARTGFVVVLYCPTGAAGAPTGGDSRADAAVRD
jgi:putative YhbY family RNA-binding protein